MTQISRPATAAEIIEIVGPLEDAVLMRIVETAATPSEVLEAFTWATADDQIGTELEHRPLRPEHSRTTQRTIATPTSSRPTSRGRARVAT